MPTWVRRHKPIYHEGHEAHEDQEDKALRPIPWLLRRNRPGACLDAAELHVRRGFGSVNPVESLNSPCLNTVSAGRHLHGLHALLGGFTLHSSPLSVDPDPIYREGHEKHEDLEDEAL